MKCGILALTLVAVLLPSAAGAQSSIAAPPPVTTHDNVKSAGTLRNGELRVALWAGMGRWSPEGRAGKTLDVAALGEEGGPLAIPSPLIRVPANTVVHASIRNTLTRPLRVSGLCGRPGPCEPILVAPGATADARVTLNAEGTFHYWASTGAASLEGRFGDDSQLGGAIVVDGPGQPPSDRIFVMGLMRPQLAVTGQDFTVINGRTWPHTERLSYQTGETARWRVLNITLDNHAMHLHGFYFKVGSVGDGLTDTLYADANVREGVTEQMPPGRTMTLAWTPERAGNWLFHCHMLVHMMPSEHDEHAAAAEPASAGMAGLVLGITVTGPDRMPRRTDTPRRDLRMTIDHDTRHGAAPSYKLAIESAGQAAPRLAGRVSPGPVMVLTRGEPVAVDIVNRLREPTAIHWHGIELESYDDGVPGFGGSAGSVTPPVPAGGNFVARFTPSRAGTFIYHTHWHNAGQLAGGIYGPLVVLEPGDTYRPSRDHVILIGLDGDIDVVPEPFVINGEAAPSPLVLEANAPNRLRFINITANNVALTVQLVNRFDPVEWVLVGKDGAATPPAGRKARPARQLVSVGETYDFELAPMRSAPPTLWLELRRGNGELLRQWPVRVK